MSRFIIASPVRQDGAKKFGFHAKHLNPSDLQLKENYSNYSRFSLQVAIVASQWTVMSFHGRLERN